MAGRVECWREGNIHIFRRRLGSKRLHHGFPKIDNKAFWITGASSHLSDGDGIIGCHDLAAANGWEAFGGVEVEEMCFVDKGWCA